MEEEITKLKKQYGDDCQAEKSDSGVKLTVSVHVSKKDDEEETAGGGFSAVVVLTCAPDYPVSAPSVQITSTAGISAAAASRMTDRLVEVATEKIGTGTVLLLVRIVRRCLLDERIHECPACKADLTGGGADSWRSHCGHFYHRACIISLIQNSARAQQQDQENRPEGSGEDQQAATERRPVCPACGLYDFALRDDKPVSRRIGGGGAGGRNRNRRGRNHPSGTGEDGEPVEGEQRRRRQRKPRGGGGGENDEGTGEVGEGAPGQRRQRKKKPSRRRRQEQRSGGEGDVEAEGEGGDDPKLFNRRRQADMRFSQFEQFRNQVGTVKGGGRGGEVAQPGYIDKDGGFYAPDGYYYYDGPSGFYAALEAYGGGGRGGSRGGGGRRRNRPRRPRGEGSNGDGGIVAEDQAIQSARMAEA